MKKNLQISGITDYPYNVNGEFSEDLVKSTLETAYFNDLHLWRNGSTFQGSVADRVRVKTIDRLAFHKSGKPRRWAIRGFKNGGSRLKCLDRFYTKANGSPKYNLRDYVGFCDGELKKEKLVARHVTVGQILSINYLNDRIDAVLDVIVPVYKGRDETMLCIYSVVKAKQLTKYNLIVVNDRSPDEVLSSELRELAAAGVIDLHENVENLGFTGSCNYAMSLNTSRDVILLNSDTEVYGDWIDRLVKAAKRDSSIGTVTPISNNATIFSYPYGNQDNSFSIEISGSEVDAIASGMPPDMDMVETPTGMGYCLYIKRSALNVVGYFDGALFGKGYGEEVDLCLRISRIGMKNFALASVYVRHFGSVSFGNEKDEKVIKSSKIISSLYPRFDEKVRDFIVNDKLRLARSYIDARRIDISQGYTKSRRILLVTHTWGGGTEKHVNDLKKSLTAQGYDVFLARPTVNHYGAFTVEIPSVIDAPSIASMNNFSITDDPDIFHSFLKVLNIDHIHIHHLIGMGYCAPLFFKTLADRYESIRVDFTLHDFLPICARINLIDSEGAACTGPEVEKCKRCTKGFHPEYAPMGFKGLYWPEIYHDFLQSCHMVIAPDESAADIVERIHGNLKVKVRPHWISPTDYELTDRIDPGHKGRARINIGVLGAINGPKGSRVLRELAMFISNNDINMAIHIIGRTDIDLVLKEYDCVKFHGVYDSGNLIEKVARAELHFMLFPAVWPETFSYTLTETALLGIPPLVFDVGAPANRVRHSGFGHIIPIHLSMSPKALVDEILRLSQTSDLFKRDGGRIMVNINEPSADDYYDKYK